MTEVIGVRFRTAGKIYYFSPAGFSDNIKRGGYVIVETARGIEIGKVIAPPHEVEDEEVIQPLKDIIRVATKEDIEQSALIRAKEKSAFHVCKSKIHEHNLDMKLIDAEYTFDSSKLLFYFTADGRIDFRDLVKDLAAVFKTRIELRQIGVRDETKILGGMGICGRVLCCHSYLSDFAPVTIKMAKDQSLSLNPTKISGTCGRLMCCLKNEQETYEELNKNLPNMGDYVTTADGISGKVQNIDVLRQKITIIVEKADEKEMQIIDASQIVSKVKKGKKPAEVQQNEIIDEAELSALMDEVPKTSGNASEGKKHKKDFARRDKKNPNREPNRESSKDANKDSNKEAKPEGSQGPKPENKKHHGNFKRRHGKGHHDNNGNHGNGDSNGNS